MVGAAATVYLAEGRARFDLIAKVNPRQVRVVLTQGMKRQVRRVLAALGYKVKRLQRIRIGPLTERGLRPGQVRLLTKAEVGLLTERRKKLSVASVSVSRDASVDRKRLSVDDSPKTRPRSSEKRTV